MPIPEGCISISVVESFNDDALLLYPSMGASTIGEAVRSFVIWSSSMIQKSPLDHAPTSSSTRDDWREKRVILWSENIAKKKGVGVVLLVYPHEAIDFKELGETNLGVVVENDISLLDTNFKDIGNVNLISWPIKQITLQDGTSLSITNTCGLSKEEEIVDYEHEEDKKHINSFRKRHGTMVNKKGR